MITKETYIIYSRLEAAYEHIEKKKQPPWNYRVKDMIIGKSLIMGSNEYWIKVIYEYDLEEDW